MIDSIAHAETPFEEPSKLKRMGIFMRRWSSRLKTMFLKMFTKNRT